MRQWCTVCDRVSLISEGHNRDDMVLAGCPQYGCGGGATLADAEAAQPAPLHAADPLTQPHNSAGAVPELQLTAESVSAPLQYKQRRLKPCNI